MRDCVSQELISAYLDNEVTDEEREQVEQALAESAEARHVLEDLQSLQKELVALSDWEQAPRLRDRVLADPRVVAATDRRLAATTSVAMGEARGRRLLRVGLIAASLAAMMLLAVFFTELFRDPGIARVPPEQDRQDIVGKEEADGPDSRDTMVAIDLPKRKPPSMVLVFDLAITPRGQQQQVFERTLNKVGIQFDPQAPGAKLEPALEKDLLNSRYVGEVQMVEQGANHDAFDVVEMVYVHGTGLQVQDLYKQLLAEEELSLRLDLGINPRETEVLLDVGQRTWALAASESPDSPHSRAYRLEFRFTLHTPSRSFLGKFPAPAVVPSLVPDDGQPASAPGVRLPFALPPNLTNDGGAADPPKMAIRGGQPVAAGEKKTVLGGDTPQEILVVLRKLAAD